VELFLLAVYDYAGSLSIQTLVCFENFLALPAISRPGDLSSDLCRSSAVELIKEEWSFDAFGWENKQPINVQSNRLKRGVYENLALSHFIHMIHFFLSLINKFSTENFIPLNILNQRKISPSATFPHASSKNFAMNF
jgi:hypothetical protein